MGPKLQLDICDLIAQFRIWLVAIGADVEKMYRQVCVIPEHQQMQRIFWRESPNEPLKEYQITRVIYGLKSAGYLAVKAMHKCAEDNAQEFPKAAEIIPKSFYMDDLLVSAHSPMEARQIRNELIGSLSKGGFKLAKWSSNDKSVIDQPEQSVRMAQEEGSVSILGLKWHPGDDTFRFDVTLQPNRDKITKRTIASDGAKFFDPTGFTEPVKAVVKMIMQNLWKMGVDWDEEVPPEMAEQWRAYYSQLSLLSEVRVPRWLGVHQDSNVQMHTFCDASQRGYGAVIYVRAENADGSVTVRLLTSKSRVAELQTITIPRLELTAARLAAQLADHYGELLGVDRAKRWCWTDSTIVLHWLKKCPSDLKVFVGNRVSEIQSLTKRKNWRHVDSKQNPADLVSRGETVDGLLKSTIWWNGPAFLAREQCHWPRMEKVGLSSTEVEIVSIENRLKTANLIGMITKSNHDGKPMLLLEKFRINRALRITAYVYRFVANVRDRVLSKRQVINAVTRSAAKKLAANKKAAQLKEQSDERVQVIPPPTPLNIQAAIEQMEPFSAQEMQQALTYWIRFTQKECYPQEWKCLDAGKELPASSTIRTLIPYLDTRTDVMRIRGRLQNSTLTYEQQHPALLPSNCLLSHKLIGKAHDETMHGGPQLCMQHLRDKYWMPGLKNAVKTYVSKCVRCTMRHGQTMSQLMADLPPSRVRVAAPFAECGVDYAGPFDIKAMSNRNVRVGNQAYVAVFICMASKAVHLELVSDLTTEAFLWALGRMKARRPHLHTLYSDNGRNFVGAANALDKVFQAWQSKDVINDIAMKGISWKFNVPRAPHHGGLWEAAVKSFKNHLCKTFGKIVFTFEEFSTVLARIEAILNSRPLVTPSGDVRDFTVITPGHLICGSQIVTPLGPLIETADLASIEWSKLRKHENEFWVRWSDEYLTTLVNRTKWSKENSNLQVNDLVIIRDDNILAGNWRRGRVMEIHTGPDGLVRSADIRTDTGVVSRPVVKLVRLPIDTKAAGCLREPAQFAPVEASAD